MGYRSDVRIVTSKKGYAELKRYTENYLKENNYEYENLLDTCDIKYENKYQVYLGWNSVKWYEYSNGYEDVSAIMNGLDHLEEKDFSYRYARIGESYDDYDEKSYESEKEQEQDLEFPCMIRDFDDEYIISNIKELETREMNTNKRSDRDER